MKYLVHLSFHTYTFHTLILLNEAQRLIDAGHEVTVMHCDGGVSHCYANTLGDKNICKLCKKLQNHWLGLLKGNYKIVSYHDLITNDIKIKTSNIEFTYDRLADIKLLTYKNVKIGFGALSTYISKTRNMYPKLDTKFKNYFNHLLKTQCEIIEILDNYVNEYKLDSIVLLNGRHFEVRPFFDYAEANNIVIKCLEKGNSQDVDDYRGFDYGPFLPHNLININNLIHKTWNESELETLEKKKLGDSFFKKRRNNIPAGDKVYTLYQKQHLLPSDWDSNKRNFVILNSSEDEFAAIGDEFDKLSFFQNQIIGIEKIAEMLADKNDIQLYLRIHPNLITIKYSYHLDLYALAVKFPNLHVIRGEEPISTYALIEHAEKIIVFGSSTGIEAVHMEKPVILLAGSLYYYMNLCYTPKTFNELENLLNVFLEPKSKLESAKYGFYILTDKGIPFDKIQLQRTKYIPFKPMKINNESYFGLFNRFYLTQKIEQLEQKNNLHIPKLEQIKQ